MTQPRKAISSLRLTPPARTDAGPWMFCELTYVRREAQAEADLAYEAWCRLPGRDGYAVYRATEDRADAAQDTLAGRRTT